MPPAWSLPVTFLCLRHRRLLGSRCPHCGHRPASRPLPSKAGHCAGPDGCGGRLDTAKPPRHDGSPPPRWRKKPSAAPRRPPRPRRDGRQPPPRPRPAHQHDPRRPPPRRCRIPAPDGAGVHPRPAGRRRPRHGVRLLTARPDPGGATRWPAWSPAARPAPFPRPSRQRGRGRPGAGRPDRPSPRPVAATRRPAPGREHLPVPRTPAPRPPGAPDLAAARAARLPDQLWPDWAVRLSDHATSARHGSSRPQR